MAPLGAGGMQFEPTELAKVIPQPGACVGHGVKGGACARRRPHRVGSVAACGNRPSLGQQRPLYTHTAPWGTALMCRITPPGAQKPHTIDAGADDAAAATAAASPRAAAAAAAAPAGVLLHDEIEHHWLAGTRHTLSSPLTPLPHTCTANPNTLCAPSHPLRNRPTNPQQPPQPTDNQQPPGDSRADVVPSRERPEGHYATPRGRSPLMQHLDYFDLWVSVGVRLAAVLLWRLRRLLAGLLTGWLVAI
jgi:hypothetical protein